MDGNCQKKGRKRSLSKGDDGGKNVGSAEKRFKQYQSTGDSFLPVFLHKPAVVKKPPKVASYTIPPVDFIGEVNLPVTIQGVSCTAFVDSGSSMTWMKHKTGKRFQFPPETVTTQKVPVSTWDDNGTYELSMVHNLEITLENSMTFRLTVAVLPEPLSAQYDAYDQDLFLGADFLHKYDVIEVYSEDKHSLYFGDDLIRRNFEPRRNVIKNLWGYCVEAHTEKNNEDCVKQMKIDTGAGYICTCVDSKGHDKVGISLGKDSWLVSKLTDNIPPGCEFNIGKNTLQDYKAVLDYRRSDLYLFVTGTPYKLKLKRLSSRTEHRTR